MNTNKFTFVEKGESIAERKKSLRAYMKRRRGDNENRDSKEILACERLFSILPSGAKRFFVYLSFSSELKTELVIERLLLEGKKVFCPRVNGSVMEAVEYGEDFSLSEFGIREPVGEKYEGKIDVVIAPLLAADCNGGRLGYGGGFYDRFFKAHPEAYKVGFCYDFQIVDSVPREEFDERLEVLVTDKRSIKINEGENYVEF